MKNSIETIASRLTETSAKSAYASEAAFGEDFSKLQSKITDAMDRAKSKAFTAWTSKSGNTEMARRAIDKLQLADDAFRMLYQLELADDSLRTLYRQRKNGKTS